MTLGFYDDLGYNYTAKFTVKPSATQDTSKGVQYTIALTDILDSEGNTIFVDDQGVALSQEEREKKLADYWGADGNNYYDDLTYDSNKGTFISIGGDGKTSQSLQLSKFKTGLTSDDYITVLDSTTGKEKQQIRESNFEDIQIDFSQSTNRSNGGKSSLRLEKGDDTGDGTGKKLGALIGLAVDSSGKIYGSYDNGNTELIGQIAVAQFANASGLEKVGNNCYQTTLNSGEFNGIGVEVDADGSSINSGQLEMSNVDLSAQFTDMIITQRGFQANSRVITVSDTLLEELINLKR
jgi:flagellar hook protein FlgE